MIFFPNMAKRLARMITSRQHELLDAKMQLAQASAHVTLLEEQLGMLELRVRVQKEIASRGASSDEEPWSHGPNTRSQEETEAHAKRMANMQNAGMTNLLNDRHNFFGMGEP